MKYFCAVFLGFAIIQTIPVESGPLDAFGSASAAASAYWNGQGQGSNHIMQNGPSASLASGHENDISHQYSSGKESGFALEIGGAHNLFKFIPNKGNMNEQEMHHHISQYLKSMKSGSNIPSTSGHGHGHQSGHQSSNKKNDISIDLDISTNQNTHGKHVDSNMPDCGQPQQHGQNYVGLAASNPADAHYPAAPEGTPHGSKDEKQISLDIDIDTNGDGKADQKINVDIDTKADEKDLGRERNNLKAGHDAHVGKHDKGLKIGKPGKKGKNLKIKKQKNKKVSNLSWSTTNHYHPDHYAPPSSVVQIHFPPPPMPMHYEGPPMPPTTTYNSMNAAASSLSMQSTTVPNRGSYAHSHAATMPGYGHSHGPMPPSPRTEYYGRGNAASTMNGIPNGMYSRADAAVNTHLGVPSYGARPNSLNHMNHVPNMQTGPYNHGASYSPMHGTQNYYDQGASLANYQQQMPHQYTQTPYHH